MPGNGRSVTGWMKSSHGSHAVTTPVLVLFSLGVVFIFVVSLRGNLLVLPPVLGLWIGVMLAPAARHSHGQECNRQMKQSRASAERSVGYLRPGFVAFTLAIWSIAVFVCWQRVVASPTLGKGGVTAAITAAEEAFRQGKLEEALKTFRSVEIPKSLSGRQAQKFHNIGVICMRLQRWDEAEGAFLEAVRYDARDISGFSNLAHLALQKKDFRRASDYLLRVLQIRRHDVEKRLSLSQCYLELGDLDRAMAELEQADSETEQGHPLKAAIQEVRERVRQRVSIPR